MMKDEHISDVSDFEAVSSYPVEEVSEWWNKKTYQQQQEFSRFLASSDNEKHLILLAELFRFSSNGYKVTNGVLYAQKVLGDHSIEDVSKNVAL